IFVLESGKELPPKKGDKRLRRRRLHDFIYDLCIYKTGFTPVMHQVFMRLRSAERPTCRG
ncbi:hypothetical protein P0G10_20350, partial [Eubacteriales bacterium DFI.9.88]|nr:hypothetical protein [Eubacteriales bacterium DFI.9.88]